MHVKVMRIVHSRSISATIFWSFRVHCWRCMVYSLVTRMNWLGGSTCPLAVGTRVGQLEVTFY